MMHFKYAMCVMAFFCIGGIPPLHGKEESPLKITLHTERVFRQQADQGESQSEKSGPKSGKVDAPVILEKPDPIRRNGNDSVELELKFMPLESRIEIFSVEASTKSEGRKVTLGIGYEERHALDGERGAEGLVPEGGTLKVSSASTDLVANGCYVCYAIGPRDAMTFILDSSDLSILHAWRSPIKDTPLASASSRLEKLGPVKFQWIREPGK